MSLYDDLDVKPGSAGGGSGGAATGWSLPMQKTLLLQQQRRSLQLQLQQQQQQQQQSSAGSGAAQQLHHQRSGSGGASVATAAGAPSAPALAAASSASSSASSSSSSSSLLSSSALAASMLNLQKGKLGSMMKRDGPGSMVVGNLGGAFRFNQRTGRMERTVPGGVGGSGIGGGGLLGAKSGANDPTLALGPDDEYNPFHPNEYDEAVGMVRAKRKMQELAESDKQQKQPKQQQQKQHKQQKQQSASATAAAAASSGHDSDGSFDRSGSDGSDHSDHEEEDKKRRMGRGAYIAPPSSLLEQDAKQPDPVPAAQQQQQQPPFGLGKPSLAAKHNVSSAAAKMMAKMGYRDGQGLGREGQGMASALSVEKTSKRGGKIVSELDRYKNPSLVIMLTNMVGPGEVDDELEDEIKDECQKYGPVVLVTIFELPRPNVPAEEAVRIFVEFERIDSAIKAMNELNGRFFGGRTVTCRFYEAEKFRDLELEGQPMPLELNE